MTRRFPVSGYAIATLHAWAEEGILTDKDRADPDMAPVCAAVDAYLAGGPYLTSNAPRYLVVSAENSDAVAWGLTELANGEDDQAEANARSNPELARMCRAACSGLSTLSGKVRRAFASKEAA